MRITTQMLNESARKAGLPVNRVSLLNYVKGNGSDSGLLGALAQKNSAAAESAKRTGYDRLEKAADKLGEKADALDGKEKDSVYDRARESGSTEEICDGVEELIGSYNNAIKILESMDGELNAYYGRSLEGILTGVREALSRIGITVSGNGTLNLDREKLQAADVDTLESVLGNTGMMKRLSYLAGRISDNAQTGANSLSTQYGSDGSSHTSSFNKYDFWG